MLDPKDQALITALDFHARQGLSELADTLGISKQLLDYRLRALQKREVITGYYAVIDSRKLGFIYGRLFVQFTSLTPQLRTKISKFVKNHKQLFWAIGMGGIYDYIFVYWAKDSTEFEQLIKEFLTEFGSVVRARSENIITNLTHLSYSFGAKKTKRLRFDLKEQQQVIVLDSVDTAVIKAVSDKARESVTALAKRAGVTEKVFGYRLKKLEEMGVIAAYRPVVDFSKLGLSYFKVFLNLDFSSPKQIAALEAALAANPKVIYLVHGIGMPGDLDIEVLAKDQAEFFAFVDGLRGEFPGVIREYNYLLYSELIKVNYFPFN